MQSTVVTLTPPTLAPVTLQEIYEVLKLDALGSPPSHPHDDLLTNLILVGTDQIEKMTNRVLMAQTLQLVVSQFPRASMFMGSRGFYDRIDDYDTRPAYLPLPKPPLIGVTSVEYYDQSNVLTTMPTTDYFVSEKSLVPALMVTDGKWWPQTYPRPDAVQVTYRAGYIESEGSPTVSAAAQRDAVPMRLRQAIKISVQLAYDDLSVEKRTAYRALMKDYTEGYRVRSF